MSFVREVQRGLQDERKLVTRLSAQLEVPNPELNPKRYRKISVRGWDFRV